MISCFLVTAGLRLEREKEVMSFGRLVDTMEKYKLFFTHISSFSGRSALDMRKYVQMRFSVIDNVSFLANRDIQQKKEKPQFSCLEVCWMVWGFSSFFDY